MTELKKMHECDECRKGCESIQIYNIEGVARNLCEECHAELTMFDGFMERKKSIVDVDDFFINIARLSDG